MTVRSWRKPCGRFQRPGEGLGRPGGVQAIKGKDRRVGKKRPPGCGQGEVITEVSSILQRAEAGPWRQPEGWGDQLKEGEGREEGGGPGRRWDEGDLFFRMLET